MPWCPKCKTEYRNGFFMCHDCDVELVSHVPFEDNLKSGDGESSEEKEDITYRDCNVERVGPVPCEDNLKSVDEESSKEEDITNHSDEEAYLITVVDYNQANLIESLLKSFNIPVLKKYRGLGHYFQIYWGFTVFGIDLYVPSLLLSTAQDILNTQPDEIENEIEVASETLAEKQFQKNYQKERRIKGWVIIATDFGFGLIALVGYGLYRLFKSKKSMNIGS